MKTRLKLYDSLLKIYLPKKEKNKLRRIAFSHKMTLSEFTRSLIRLAIYIDQYQNSSIQDDYSLSKIEYILGGFRNK